MRLVINGDSAEVPEGLTFAQLLVHLGFTDGPVAIERNGQIVPRREHGTTLVIEGDTLEIVHFVGGGS